MRRSEQENLFRLKLCAYADKAYSHIMYKVKLHMKRAGKWEKLMVQKK